MMQHRGKLISLLIPTVGLLVACASAPTPTTSPSPTSTATPLAAIMTLSPVPLTLRVPEALVENIWVAPLTGPDIRLLAPEATIQLQYRNGTTDEPMIANLLWFTNARYAELMASVDAPKGIEMGFQGSHVLFVQPALDMPFDPASKDGKNYGTLVARARDFRWYAMSDPSLTLLRPCPAFDSLPTTDVDSAMLAVITDYFDKQGLTPVKLINATARVLDVHAQVVGTHDCANPDGGMGGYTGVVPVDATEAVMAYVSHKPYPATGAASTFITLAKLPGAGWKVVGEGTGP